MVKGSREGWYITQLSYAHMHTSHTHTHTHTHTPAPPLITEPPQNTETAYGQDVVFRCFAVGPPTPNITWIKIGSEIQVRIQHVYIQQVRVQHVKCMYDPFHSTYTIASFPTQCSVALFPFQYLVSENTDVTHATSSLVPIPILSICHVNVTHATSTCTIAIPIPVFSNATVICMHM